MTISRGSSSQVFSPSPSTNVAGVCRVEQETEKPLRTFCTVLTVSSMQLLQHFPPTPIPTGSLKQSCGMCSAAEGLLASPGPSSAASVGHPDPPLQHWCFSSSAAPHPCVTGSDQASSAAHQSTCHGKYFPVPNFREALLPLFLPVVTPLALFWGSFVWPTLAWGGSVRVRGGQSHHNSKKISSETRRGMQNSLQTVSWVSEGAEGA